MNLITISGFLGSGKTTILLSIAKYLTEVEHKKVAIIENEIGKVGVDGDYLRSEGLQIKEIYSGCICCSLRTDIIQTLLQLEREFNPDVVLLEPSGVANLLEVQRCLNGYSGEIDHKQTITIIDPLRFYKLRDFSAPLISNSIKYADLVIINKADLVTDDEIWHLKERIKNYNRSANIIAVSAIENNGLDEIYSNLTQEIIRRPEPDYILNLPQENIPSHEQAITYSSKRIVEFKEPTTSAEIESRITRYLSELTTLLINEGCDLIGHLKVIAREKNKGYLMAGKTSFEHAPHIKGKLATSLSSLTYTINVIVYGIDKTILENITTTKVEDILFNTKVDSILETE